MTTEDFLRQQILPLAYRQLPASELMSRAAAGDTEAFIALICTKFSVIEGTCRQVLGPAGPTEDVALETFVQLWRQRRKIRNPKAIDAWLMRTARNLARKQAAAQTRGRAAGREWLQRTGAMAPLAEQPDRSAIQAEMIRRVRHAMAEQSDADQHVLWTAEHSDGDAQAAEALGLPLSAYRVRLHRARQRLRSLLKKYGVAPVVGAVAVLGAGRNRAASTMATLWTTNAGKAFLFGLTLCAVITGASLLLTRKPTPTDDAQPPANRAPGPPPATVAVESLQDKNVRIVREDLLAQLREITQAFYPADNPIRVAGVRAFGSEVEIEFEATRPLPPMTGQATRLRGRYCTYRRRLVVHGQPAGSDRWYKMNPEKPAAIIVPVPLVGLTEVVIGREAYAATKRLFDTLPRDARAEREMLHFLFGPPGGELRLPAGANGFAADDGRMWLVDGDLDMYVRDRAGRWRYDGECRGWWLVAHDGKLYYTADNEIFVRLMDPPGSPWSRSGDLPPRKPGEKTGFLAIAGDRIYAAIHPNVFCWRPLADPKAAWVREESPAPVWPDGIAATADRLFGHDAKHLVTRPLRDPAAPWIPLARWPDGCIFLVVDSDRLLAFNSPGPIYGRPLAAGPNVDWEVVGQAHLPPRQPQAPEALTPRRK